MAADTDEDVRWPVAAARAADAKNATDVVVLEVGEVLAVCGLFVIASAPNDRLVRAIAEEIEKVVGEAGGPKPIRTEGLDDLRWVLLDYGDFVAHVFLQESRDYYDLERLWSDVPRIDWRQEQPPDQDEAAG
ncbi:MAG: ribosome silencing factor [Acidimicrobiales bacterium]|nr:ribosome silencing factor [Acidimicrobiales bacterium]